MDEAPGELGTFLFNCSNSDGFLVLTNVLISCSLDCMIDSFCFIALYLKVICCWTSSEGDWIQVQLINSIYLYSIF